MHRRIIMIAVLVALVATTAALVAASAAKAWNCDPGFTQVGADHAHSLCIPTPPQTPPTPPPTTSPVPLPPTATTNVSNPCVSCIAPASPVASLTYSAFCVQTKERGDTFVSAYPGAFAPGDPWRKQYDESAVVTISGHTVTFFGEEGEAGIRPTTFERGCDALPPMGTPITSSSRLPQGAKAPEKGKRWLTKAS